MITGPIASLFNIPADIRQALEQSVLDAGYRLKNSAVEVEWQQTIDFYCLDGTADNLKLVQAALTEKIGAVTVLLVKGQNATVQAANLMLPTTWTLLSWPSPSDWLNLMLKRAKQRLQESFSEQTAKQRFDQAIQTADLLSWGWDLETGKRLVYSHALDLPNSQDAQTLILDELISPEDLGADLARFEYAIRHAHRYQSNVRINLRGQTQRWLQLSGEPIRSASGEVIAVSGLGLDVTERHAIDEELADARALLFDSLDAGRMYCWEWNLSDNSRRTIGPSRSILGTSATVTNQAQALIHPDDLAQDEALLAEAIETHSNYENEFRIIRPDGEIRWIFSRGKVVLDQDGKPARLSGVAVDVSDRRAVEQKLTRANESLRLALDAAKLNPWRIDLLGNNHDSGPRVVELFGERIASLEHFRTFVVTEDRSLIASMREREFLASGETKRFEFRVRHRDGKLLWLASHARCVHDDSGRPVQIVGVCHDISEARLAQEKLASSLTQLERVQSATNVLLWEWTRKDGMHCYQSGGLELAGAELPEVHPDDRRRVLHSLLRCALSGESFDEEFRISIGTLEYNWVAMRGGRIAVDAKQGHPVLSGVIIDISSRKRAEKKLLIAEERLRRALDAAKMVCWAWNIDNTLEPDPWLADYSPKIAADHNNGGGFVHPDDRERHRASIDDALSGKSKDYRCEFRMLRPDGNVTWLLSIGSRQFDNHGKLLGLAGVAIDVSAQKSTEQELAENREWHDMAVSAGELNLWRVDLKTGERFGGALDEKIFGFIPSSVEQVEDLIHPDDQTRVDDAWRYSIASKEPYSIDYRLVLRDGALRWLRVRGKCKQDTVTGNWQMVGATIDVTVQKELEYALEESREWQRLAISAGKLNLWRIDVVTGERFGGDLDQTMFGSTPNDVAAFENIIHPDDREREIVEWRRSIEHGDSYAIDHRIIRPDRSVRWIRVRGERLKAGRNKNPQMVGTTMDITDQMNADFELQRALSAARQASEAKSSFLASMSHELRTPLNAVVGFSGLLMNTEMDGVQYSHVQALNSSAHLLHSLINDVLDFSRIEAGEMHIEQTPFNLLDCLESTLDLVASVADQKGLCLLMTATGDIYQAVLGDSLRLRQIVANLLSNAIKFTELGTVSLELETSRLDEHMDVVVRVRDTGIGMDETVISRLFQAFCQGDVSTTRRFGGSGLGLSISKRLVELMGGSIHVSSVPEEGTCFEVQLKLALGSEVSEAPSQMHGKRIGIALRSESMKKGLAIQMHEFEAMAKVIDPEQLTEQFSRDDNLNALVVDEALLPALSRVRQWPRNKSGELIPVLVLSGIDQALLPRTGSHGERYLSIVRTVKPRQLYRALSQLFEAESATPISVGRALEEARRATGSFDEKVFDVQRILIVEDNEINQTLLLLQLESLGLTAMLANDGLDALMAVAAQSYDIILMDVEMPTMDGMEAATAIRTDPAYQHCSPYIIATTAHVLGDSRARFLSKGMDDFISKPVILDELKAALERAYAANQAKA
jgi:PAS domain S-box-containing protein